MALTTLKLARRGLAHALDDLGVYSVAASTSTTVSSVDMADNTAGASAGRYNAAYLYACESALQRRVMKDSLVPASGQVTLNYSWTLVTAGTEIEVTRLFPARPGLPGEHTSYQTLIQKAAAKLLVPDRITVPINTTDSISLAAYPWLDRIDRIQRFMEPPPFGSRPLDANWRGWHLVHTAGVPTLEPRVPFDVASGDLTIEALRPSDTLISGVESPPGSVMTTDTQTVIAPLESLIVLGMLEAYRALSNRNPGVPGDWDAKLKAAQARAEAMFHFDGTYYKQRAPEEAAA